MVMANLSTIALMPRFGPRPLIASGMLAAAAGTAWLTQLGPTPATPPASSATQAGRHGQRQRGQQPPDG